MIKAVIWDFDGVMVDSFNTCFLAYQEIFKQAGKKPFEDIKDFHQWYDSEWPNNFKRLGIPFSGEKYDKCVELFKNKMQNNNFSFYSDIEEVLKQTRKRYSFAIVSSNHRSTITDKLDKHNLTDLFNIIVSHIDGIIKPNPYQFLVAMDEIKVSPDEVISVGDVSKDVLTAKNAGVENIVSVTYGWENKKTQDKRLKELGVMPSVFVDSPKELLEYFNSLD